MRIKLILVAVVILEFALFHQLKLQVSSRVVYAGERSGGYKLPEYDEKVSITFKKPYIALKDELLYARVTGLDEADERKTFRLIRDKKQLVEIAREFDKLKSVMPTEYEYSPEKTSSYVIVMWRERKSVSYVAQHIDSLFYYQPGPDGRQVVQMPTSLVEILGFKNRRQDSWERCIERSSK